MLLTFLDDLHSFDPATRTWTLLSAANDTRRPSSRAFHGFTSAGGLLYVHGGYSNNEGDVEAVGRGLQVGSRRRLAEKCGLVWSGWRAAGCDSARIPLYSQMIDKN